MQARHQIASSNISQSSTTASAGIAVSRSHARQQALHSTVLQKLAASIRISQPSIPPPAYNITVHPLPLANPIQPLPDTLTIDPAAEQHILQQQCSARSTLLWSSQEVGVQNVPLPSARELQSSVARSFISWWGRATRLGVMGSSVLLAASLVADLRTNAWIIGQCAACSSAASLPAGAVRSRGSYPAPY